ncbi:Transcription initiation factor TFIID subunit 2 [Holothuria leucospilota]|uniref:Transcription initiation factor TFIID subunit 2 n=1 Tax=Holothuria leucospilota TaxID=206669 RepID=A0A9Q1BTZ3_HOLLE|nr:Transcription initiation factor TFIID subunit 2 [Holothuria leucospilota]
MNRNSKKAEKSSVSPRPFKLSHQIVCLTGLNFAKRSIVGFVELHLLPLKSDLKRIRLNSKQCRVYRVTINDIWEASFIYSDPTLAICQNDTKQRNLHFFSDSHQVAVGSVDPDQANGELVVRIPDDALFIVRDQRMLRVSIEFSVERPQGGLHFVIPDGEGSFAKRGAHMFTCGVENASRLWFPCVDTYSEPCTWKLEFTVDKSMTAVSCGELVDTVYTPDLKKKTFHYMLTVPTAAPNISLAVGPFEIFVDPTMPEVTHFCLPGLKSILMHSTAFLHEAFEFYEDTLAATYPYSCYKQVFVDEAYEEYLSYATMSILSTNLLHSKHIIDQTFSSRRCMVNALTEQYFGSYISPNSWYDSWLTKGISKYLCNIFLKKLFGTNEYRYHIHKDLKRICEYEQTMGGIILNPEPFLDHSSLQTEKKPSHLYFPTDNPHTISYSYWKLFGIKAHYVMRLIEIRIGQELLLKVFNKLLSLATSASQQKFMLHSWGNMLISTSGFLKSLSSVSGKDLATFVEQWVTQGGIAQFHGNFHFNRKRNVVELELRQDPSRPGINKYVGPLKVTIQELDGSFEHTLQVEENITKGEITCHSKSRRHKKKKIPLMNGEEVDMDLNAMDADSPVLWIRVDTAMTLVRHVFFEQPDFQWQYQLRYERDVVAQIEAIDALAEFPSMGTISALSDIISDHKTFYRVRTKAANCFAKVANKLMTTFSGHSALITIFKKIYGSYSCPEIVRRNNFSNFPSYFLIKELPKAMGLIRNTHSICPRECLNFLLDLIKYCDNTKNHYSDNYYRAALIDALTNTITPAVSTVNTSVDNLIPETKLILEEVVRCLNLEKILPSYQYTVTVSCLKAIRTLQKNGHLPSDSTLFQSYAQYGHFITIREVAMESLVDIVKVENNGDIFGWLLDLAEQDPVPYMRHKILSLLIENPPFKQRESSPLSTDALVERLWTYMNCNSSHDCRLRCDVVDFFYKLYGISRPTCLPMPELGMVLNLKEKKTVLHSQVSPDNSVVEEPFQQESSSVPEEVPEVPHEERKRKLSSPLGTPVETKMPRMSSDQEEPFVDVITKSEDERPPTPGENLSDYGAPPTPGGDSIKEESISSSPVMGLLDDIESSRDSFPGRLSGMGSAGPPDPTFSESKPSPSDPNLPKKKKKNKKHKHKQKREPSEMS